MESLVDIVREDVFAFLKSNEELLFNERDFQMHLATWLRGSANAYDDVDVEYYVPVEELKKVGEYVWESELRLDVVVKKDAEYCPIELKYKTKKVERQISRFDEVLSEEVVVMKNQGAQDLGMYNFWKDIRRVELVCKRFKNVNSGLAVFVTNDSYYVKERNSNRVNNHHLFSMSAGEHGTIKRWQNENSACAKSYKSFEVDNRYTIQWNERMIEEERFYYCIVTI